MQNKSNKAASSHADGAATSANETGVFYFSFPFSKEPTAIFHSCAASLSPHSKQKAAYDWLNNCLLPAYDSALEKFNLPLKNPVLEEIKERMDKAGYKETIWNMLYGFIVELPTGWTEFQKGSAMSMYKNFEELADFIFE